MNQPHDYLDVAGANFWNSLVDECIEILRRAEDSDIALLNFWAYRGGGKTTFLHQLAKLLPNAEADVAVTGLWDVSDGDLAQVMEDISTAVKAAGPTRKVVLLDNLDALLRSNNGEAFFEFEQGLVLELLERKDVLLITTSQIPMGTQWRAYEVRIRQENHPLPALSRAEVDRLAETWSLDPEWLFTLSQGYPWVLFWLREHPDITDLDLAQQIEAYFLGSLPTLTRKLAFEASLLPWFDIAVLREIRETEFLETEGLYAGYIEHLRQLIGIGLIMWDMEMGAYRFCNSTVRRLLARSFRLLLPQEFAYIHQQAATYYQKEARRAAYLHYTLVSTLYHLAQFQLTQVHDPETVGKECLKWLYANLEMWPTADWEAVVKAWQQGSGDESVREELRALLGPGAFEEIARLLEGAKSAVEVMDEYTDASLD